MHVDSSNGKSADLSHVFVMSKMIWEKKNVCGWRITVICYTRDSITHYLKRKNFTDGLAINHLVNIYSQFNTSRQSIASLNKKLCKNKIISTLLKDNYYENKCHMNPSVFLSPVVHHTVLLTFKYALNYIEVVSILRASIALQWAPYISVKCVSDS